MPTSLTEPMRGTITEGVLCTLLGKLHGDRLTGILRFTGVEVSSGAPRVASRALTFSHGDVVAVESNVDSEALGPVLLRGGAVTTGDLMRAGVHAREWRQALEWALEDLGLLGPEKSRDAFIDQSTEALARIFTWTDGVYTFEERETPSLAPLADMRVSLADLVARAIELLDNVGLERALGDPSRPLRAGPRPPDPGQSSAEDLGLMEAADGRKAARQLLAAGRCPAPGGYRRLIVLLSTGALERFEPGTAEVVRLKETPRVEEVKTPPPAPRPVPPPAPVVEPVPAPVAKAAATPAAKQPVAAPAEKSAREQREQITAAFSALLGATHFEVLGVSTTASEAEIKSAYARLARQYHPDSQNDPALADLRDKLVALLIAVGEAHQVLRDPARRSAYQATLAAAPTQAAEPPGSKAAADPVEDYILRAHASLGRKDVNDAVQMLEYVLALPDVRSDLRKAARVLLARAYRLNPKLSREAERVLLDIVGDDPSYVPGYLALGSLYKDEGMRSRALRMFRKVAELDPQNAAAQEEIDQLG